MAGAREGPTSGGLVLEETGMTEEELAKVFDLRQPTPG